MLGKTGKIIRLISLILAIAFFGNEFAFAAPDLASSELFVFHAPAAPLELPHSAGVAEEVFSPAAQKQIYLIQDAHTNPSAQKNIAKIIECLAEQQKIRWVFLEGGFGNDSLSGFHGADAAKRKIVAESYLARGELSGAEYLNLTSDRAFSLWGVEDKELYFESLKVYSGIAQNREKFQDYLKKIRQTVETLKPQIFNPALQAFDQKNEDYSKQKITLSDYYAVLLAEARQRNIPMAYYPHLSALDDLLTKENSIDFKKATAEAQSAIASLPVSASDELKQAAPRKLTSKNPREEKAFYALLEEKLKNSSTDTASDYPELSKYFEYLKLWESIDSSKLIEEEKQLEAALYLSLAVTEDEKDLYRAGEMLTELEGLFDLTLTPDEFQAYAKDSRDFDITYLTGFLNRKIMDLGNNYERAVFLEKDFDEFVKQAGLFYGLTRKRDEHFIEKTLRKMDAEGADKAILVTGGYHAPNLKSLLRDKKIGYTTIAPQVLYPTNLKRYEKVLLAATSFSAISDNQLAPVVVMSRPADCPLLNPKSLHDLVPSISAARLAAEKPAPKKIAVIGASSFVGQEIASALGGVYPEVIQTSFQTPVPGGTTLDVTNETQIKEFIENVKPDVIIYASAEANPDKAEQDPAPAEALNAKAPALIEKYFNGKLIYLSTDYVFDGKNPPYDVDAPTSPINVYGRTKQQGEEAVLARPGNAVLRLGRVFGEKGSAERNYLKLLLQELRLGGKIAADDKDVRSPVDAADISKLVLDLIANDRSGVFHLNGPEPLTKYEFTLRVAATYFELFPWFLPPGQEPWLYAGSIVYRKTTVAVAPRPSNTRLINSISPTPLSESLRRLIWILSKGPENEVLDEETKERQSARLFSNFYDAYGKGYAPRFDLFRGRLEEKGIRWAVVGHEEEPRAWEGKPRVYDPHERDEIFDRLTAGITLRSDEVKARVRRAIEACTLNIPRNKIGMIFVEADSDSRGEFILVNVLSPQANIDLVTYFLVNKYMEELSFYHGIQRVRVPNEAAKAPSPSREKLLGGSFSTVEKVQDADGSFYIEKTANPKQDGGKLLREGRFMQGLPPSQARWFPKVREISDGPEKTLVRMEYVKGATFSDVAQWSFSPASLSFQPTLIDALSKLMVARLSHFDLARKVYGILKPDFYSKAQRPTPPDFIEKYYFGKITQRWQEAGEKSPKVAALLKAPYVDVRYGGARGREFYVNLPTLVRLIKLISKKHPEYFNPPYLSKQHGDLHFGNILVEPYEYYLDGSLNNMKLIDPSGLEDGHDPLYDFAKLIHNLYGAYDLMLYHHLTYHFGITTDSGPGKPAVMSEFFDDEASGTLQLMDNIDQFATQFGQFLSDPNTNLFNFEKDNFLWRPRLLFVHAFLLAGLFSFHAVGDGREAKVSVLYERSLSEFYKLIGVYQSLNLLKEYKGLEKLWGRIEKASKGKDEAAFSKLTAELDQALSRYEKAGARLAADKTAPWGPKLLEAQKFIDQDPEFSAAYQSLLLQEKRNGLGQWTIDHEERVAVYAYELSAEFSLSLADRRALVLAARFHDTGKSHPKLRELVDHEGDLNDEKKKILEEHVQFGADILTAAKAPARAVEILMQHHERPDGKGYPGGLKNEQINLMAKVLSVADAFDAMTQDRPYRDALGVEKAFEEFDAELNKQFDEDVVDRFWELYTNKTYLGEAMVLKHSPGSGARLSLSRFLPGRGDGPLVWNFGSYGKRANRLLEVSVLTLYAGLALLSYNWASPESRILWHTMVMAVISTALIDSAALYFGRGGRVDLRQTLWVSLIYGAFNGVGIHYFYNAIGSWPILNQWAAASIYSNFIGIFYTALLYALHFKIPSSEPSIYQNEFDAKGAAGKFWTSLKRVFFINLARQAAIQYGLDEPTDRAIAALLSGAFVMTLQTYFVNRPAGQPRTPKGSRLAGSLQKNQISMIAVHLSEKETNAGLYSSQEVHDVNRAALPANTDLMNSGLWGQLYYYEHEGAPVYVDFGAYHGKRVATDTFSGKYEIPGLKGNIFVLTGGALGYCHLYAFLNLVRYAAGHPDQKFEIHLPADAIYVTEIFDADETVSYPVGPATLLPDSYVKALDESGVPYQIVRPGSESAPGPKLSVYLWPDTNSLKAHLEARLHSGSRLGQNIVVLDPTKIKLIEDEDFWKAVDYFNHEIIAFHESRIEDMNAEKIVDLYELLRGDRDNVLYVDHPTERDERLNSIRTVLPKRGVDMPGLANQKFENPRDAITAAAGLYTLITKSQALVDAPGFDLFMPKPKNYGADSASDGHHRLAWFLMNYLLIRNGCPPFYFKDKAEFLSVKKSIKESDYSPLEGLLVRSGTKNGEPEAANSEETTAQTGGTSKIEDYPDPARHWKVRTPHFIFDRNIQENRLQIVMDRAQRYAAEKDLFRLLAQTTQNPAPRKDLPVLVDEPGLKPSQTQLPEIIFVTFPPGHPYEDASGEKEGKVDYPVSKWTPRQYFLFLRSVAQTMEYLRSNNISHRDFKPENIYIPSELLGMNHSREDWDEDEIREHPPIVHDFDSAMMVGVNAPLSHRALYDREKVRPLEIGTQAYAPYNVENEMKKYQHEMNLDLFSFGAMVVRHFDKHIDFSNLQQQDIDDRLNALQERLQTTAPYFIRTVRALLRKKLSEIDTYQWKELIAEINFALARLRRNEANLQDNVEIVDPPAVDAEAPTAITQKDKAQGARLATQTYEAIQFSHKTFTDEEVEKILSAGPSEPDYSEALYFIVWPIAVNFYHRYFSHQNVQSQEGAGDLVQGVVLELLKMDLASKYEAYSASHPEGRGLFVPWLKTIVSWQLISLFRHDYRRQLTDAGADLGNFESASPSPVQSAGMAPLSAEEQVIDQEMTTDLRNAILSLPDAKQTLVLLLNIKFVHDSAKDAEERADEFIASKLGVAAGTVRHELIAARETVRKKMLLKGYGEEDMDTLERALNEKDVLGEILQGIDLSDENIHKIVEGEAVDRADRAEGRRDEMQSQQGELAEIYSKLKILMKLRQRHFAVLLAPDRNEPYTETWMSHILHQRYDGVLPVVYMNTARNLRSDIYGILSAGGVVVANINLGDLAMVNKARAVIARAINDRLIKFKSLWPAALTEEDICGRLRFSKAYLALLLTGKIPVPAGVMAGMQALSMETTAGSRLAEETAGNGGAVKWYKNTALAAGLITFGIDWAAKFSARLIGPPNYVTEPPPMMTKKLFHLPEFYADFFSSSYGLEHNRHMIPYLYYHYYTFNFVLFVAMCSLIVRFAPQFTKGWKGVLLGVLAGAAYGNAVEGVFFGYLTNMISMPTGQVFNIGDVVALSAAAVILGIFSACLVFDATKGAVRQVTQKKTNGGSELEKISAGSRLAEQNGQTRLDLHSTRTVDASLYPKWVKESLGLGETRLKKMADHLRQLIRTETQTGFTGKSKEILAELTAIEAVYDGLKNKSASVAETEAFDQSITNLLDKVLAEFGDLFRYMKERQDKARREAENIRSMGPNGAGGKSLRTAVVEKSQYLHFPEAVKAYETTNLPKAQELFNKLKDNINTLGLFMFLHLDDTGSPFLEAIRKEFPFYIKSLKPEELKSESKARRALNHLVKTHLGKILRAHQIREIIPAAAKKDAAEYAADLLFPEFSSEAFVSELHTKRFLEIQAKLVSAMGAPGQKSLKEGQGEALRELLKEIRAAREHKETDAAAGQVYQKELAMGMRFVSFIGDLSTTAGDLDILMDEYKTAPGLTTKAEIVVNYYRVLWKLYKNGNMSFDECIAYMQKLEASANSLAKSDKVLAQYLAEARRYILNYRHFFESKQWIVFTDSVGYRHGQEFNFLLAFGWSGQRIEQRHLVVTNPEFIHKPWRSGLDLEALRLLRSFGNRTIAREVHNVFGEPSIESIETDYPKDGFISKEEALKHSTNNSVGSRLSTMEPPSVSSETAAKNLKVLERQLPLAFGMAPRSSSSISRVYLVVNASGIIEDVRPIDSKSEKGFMSIEVMVNASFDAEGNDIPVEAAVSPKVIFRGPFSNVQSIILESIGRYNAAVQENLSHAAKYKASQKDLEELLAEFGKFHTRLIDIHDYMLKEEMNAPKYEWDQVWRAVWAIQGYLVEAINAGSESEVSKELACVFGGLVFLSLENSPIEDALDPSARFVKAELLSKIKSMKDKLLAMKAPAGSRLTAKKAALEEYGKRLEALGSPPVILGEYKTLVDQDRIPASVIEHFLDHLPDQIMLVKSGKPLKFGPGVLYHGGANLDEALIRGKLSGGIPLTRVAHEYASLVFRAYQADSPAIYMVRTSVFNRYLAEKKAEMKLLPTATQGFVDPYPRIEEALPLDEVEEIWVTEDDYSRYRRIAGGIFDSPVDRLLKPQLDILFAKNKIMAVPGLGAERLKNSPVSRWYANGKVREYLIQRNLLMEIPVLAENLPAGSRLAKFIPKSQIFNGIVIAALAALAYWLNILPVVSDPFAIWFAKTIGMFVGFGIISDYLAKRSIGEPMSWLAASRAASYGAMNGLATVGFFWIIDQIPSPAGNAITRSLLQTFILSQIRTRIKAKLFYTQGKNAKKEGIARRRYESLWLSRLHAITSNAVVQFFPFWIRGAAEAIKTQWFDHYFSYANHELRPSLVSRPEMVKRISNYFPTWMGKEQWALMVYGLIAPVLNLYDLVMGKKSSSRDRDRRKALMIRTWTPDEPRGQTYSHPFQVQRFVMVELSQRFKTSEVFSVLDAGAGADLYTLRNIKSHFPEANAHALDILPIKQIDLDKNEPFIYHEHFLEETDIASGYFQAIISTLMLDFIDIDKATQEIHRLLASDGIAIVVVHQIPEEVLSEHYKKIHDLEKLLPRVSNADEEDLIRGNMLSIQSFIKNQTRFDSIEKRRAFFRAQGFEVLKAVTVDEGEGGSLVGFVLKNVSTGSRLATRKPRNLMDVSGEAHFTENFNSHQSLRLNQSSDARDFLPDWPAPYNAVVSNNSDDVLYIRLHDFKGTLLTLHLERRPGDTDAIFLNNGRPVFTGHPSDTTHEARVSSAIKTWFPILLEWLKARGFKALRVELLDDDKLERSRKFFESYGFKSDGDRRMVKDLQASGVDGARLAKKSEEWVPVEWDLFTVIALLSLDHPSLPKLRINKHDKTIEIKWIEGPRLQEWAGASRLIPDDLYLRQIIQWSIQIGEAIVLLHEMGVEHGDISGDNVVLETSPSGEMIPKLIDFSDGDFNDVEHLRMLLHALLMRRVVVTEFTGAGMVLIDGVKIFEKIGEKFDKELVDIARGKHVSAQAFVNALRDYLGKKFVFGSRLAAPSRIINDNVTKAYLPDLREAWFKKGANVELLEEIEDVAVDQKTCSLEPMKEILHPRLRVVVYRIKALNAEDRVMWAGNEKNIHIALYDVSGDSPVKLAQARLIPEPLQPFIWEVSSTDVANGFRRQALMQRAFTLLVLKSGIVQLIHSSDPDKSESAYKMYERMRRDARLEISYNEYEGHFVSKQGGLSRLRNTAAEVSDGSRLAVEDRLTVYGVNVHDGQADLSQVPLDADWIMTGLRPLEKGNIVTEPDAIPAVQLTHHLTEAVLLSREGESSKGVYLGLANVSGREQVVVIKEFDPDKPIEDELIHAQVMERLGVGPRFYGVVKENGEIKGYAMQLALGKPMKWSQFIASSAYPDLKTIRERLMEVGLSSPDDIIQTPSGGFIAIDAGNLRRIYGRKYKSVWDYIDEQNLSGSRLAETTNPYKRLTDVMGAEYNKPSGDFPMHVFGGFLETMFRTLWENVNKIAAKSGYPNARALIYELAQLQRNKITEKRSRSKAVNAAKNISDMISLASYKMSTFGYPVRVNAVYSDFRGVVKRLIAERRNQADKTIRLSFFGPGFFHEPIEFYILALQEFKANGVTTQEFPLEMHVFDKADDLSVFSLIKQNKIYYAPTDIEKLKSVIGDNFDPSEYFTSEERGYRLKPEIHSQFIIEKLDLTNPAEMNRTTKDLKPQDFVFFMFIMHDIQQSYRPQIEKAVLSILADNGALYSDAIPSNGARLAAAVSSGGFKEMPSEDFSQDALYQAILYKISTDSERYGHLKNVNWARILPGIVNFIQTSNSFAEKVAEKDYASIAATLLRVIRHKLAHAQRLQLEALKNAGTVRLDDTQLIINSLFFGSRLADQDESHRLDKNLKWGIDYLLQSDELPDRADILFVPGHGDIPTLEKTAEIFWKNSQKQEARFEWVVVSGGIGRLTPALRENVRNSRYLSSLSSDIDKMTEAEIIQDILVANGVPSEKILLEKRATVTTQNFEYLKELLKEKGLKGDTIVFVASPYQGLRTKAAFQLVFGQNALGINYTPQNLAIPDLEVLDIPSKMKLAQIVLAELGKLEIYPSKGFIGPFTFSAAEKEAIQKLRNSYSLAYFLTFREEAGLHVVTGSKAYVSLDAVLLTNLAKILSTRHMVVGVDQLNVLKNLRENWDLISAFFIQESAETGLEALNEGAYFLFASEAISAEAILTIRGKYPHSLIFIELSIEGLSDEALSQTVSKSLKKGASGIILKPFYRGGESKIAPERIERLARQFPQVIFMVAGGVFEDKVEQVLRLPQNVVAACGINAKTPEDAARQADSYRLKTTPASASRLAGNEPDNDADKQADGARLAEVEQLWAPVVEQATGIIRDAFVKEDASSPFIVTVDGMAGSGKTTFTELTGKSLERMGFSVMKDDRGEYASLDMFLKTKEWRSRNKARLMEAGVPEASHESVFHEERVRKFFDDIRRFAESGREEDEIVVENAFHHATETYETRVFKIRRSMIVLVEGAYAGATERANLKFRVESEQAGKRFAERFLPISPDYAKGLDRYHQLTVGPTFDAFRKRHPADYSINSDRMTISAARLAEGYFPQRSQLYDELWANDEKYTGYIQALSARGAKLKQGDVGVKGYSSRTYRYERIFSKMQGVAGPLEGKHILEIGPGPGLFLLYLKDKGINAQGLEPNPELVSLARQRGLNITQNSLEEVEPGSFAGPFDITFSRNVLDLPVIAEQRSEISATDAAKKGKMYLEKLAQLTKPGGFSIHQAEQGWPFKEEDIKASGFEIMREHSSAGFVVLRRNTPGSRLAARSPKVTVTHEMKQRMLDEFISILKNEGTAVKSLPDYPGTKRYEVSFNNGLYHVGIYDTGHSKALAVIPFVREGRQRALVVHEGESNYSVIKEAVEARTWYQRSRAWQNKMAEEISDPVFQDRLKIFALKLWKAQSTSQGKEFALLIDKKFAARFRLEHDAKADRLKLILKQLDGEKVLLEMTQLKEEQKREAELQQNAGDSVGLTQADLFTLTQISAREVLPSVKGLVLDQDIQIEVPLSHFDIFDGTQRDPQIRFAKARAEAIHRANPRVQFVFSSDTVQPKKGIMTVRLGSTAEILTSSPNRVNYVINGLKPGIWADWDGAFYAAAGIGAAYAKHYDAVNDTIKFSALKPNDLDPDFMHYLEAHSTKKDTRFRMLLFMMFSGDKLTQEQLENIAFWLPLAEKVNWTVIMQGARLAEKTLAASA